MILFNILESVDSYEDFESITVSHKLENTLSSYHLYFTILFVFVLFIHLSYHTALPISIKSLDLLCFRIYIFF